MFEFIILKRYQKYYPFLPKIGYKGEETFGAFERKLPQGFSNDYPVFP